MLYPTMQDASDKLTSFAAIINREIDSLAPKYESIIFCGIRRL